MKIASLLIFLSAFLLGCLGYKELPVEYDYSYRGDFKNYRTFDLMQGPKQDSSLLNAVITKSIISRMKFLGYRQTERKPHLLVIYKLFPDSLLFNGYEQPEIEQWIQSHDENLNYDKKKLDMKSGTLLIQLYDRRMNRSIWQGYSTSIYGSIDFTNNKTVRNAVISILDKYRFWAEGFIERREKMQEETEN